MSRDPEKKLVFATAPSAEAGGPLTLIIGIPRAAYEEMKDGVSQTMDLRKVGIPVQVIVYGAATHDEAMAPLKKFMADDGLPYLDMRNKDFTIR